MRRVWILLLALLIAVPAYAATQRIVDESGLIQEQQLQFLEDEFAALEAEHGFTPAVVTVDSFGGLSAQDYAEEVYDIFGYGEDGILYLVSIPEGQWYILTRGLCAERITDAQVSALGEELAVLLRQGQYYEAFSNFANRSAKLMYREPEETTAPTTPPVTEKSPVSPKVTLWCMLAGLAVGGITVGIMAAQLKSVRPRGAAMDYIRPGSTQLTNSRDIFLYAHTTRRAKPKSNGSGSSGGYRGRSSGGAGGRI